MDMVLETKNIYEQLEGMALNNVEGQSKGIYRIEDSEYSKYAVNWALRDLAGATMLYNWKQNSVLLFVCKIRQPIYLY